MQPSRDALTRGRAAMIRAGAQANGKKERGHHLLLEVIETTPPCYNLPKGQLYNKQVCARLDAHES